MIPCTDTCFWQQDGVCTLDTRDNAIGQPSDSHPCLHYVPIVPEPAAATPGRYSPPEEAPNQRVPSDL